MSDHPEQEAQSMRAAAELFSVLLLQEVNAELIRNLDQSGARAHLDTLGLHLPDPEDKDAIDELAAQYFESFIKPVDMPPLVQSLVEEGSFEGKPAQQMREIAKSGDLEFEPMTARGAPVDHLGSQLSLWIVVNQQSAELSSQFSAQHLKWSLPHLKRRSNDSFYGTLSGLVADFINCT